MRQLGITGEIEWTAPRQSAGRFEFRAARPGRMASVSVNVPAGVVSTERISVKGWGILNALHSSTGVRGGRPEATRDWWLTRVWSFSMDAVCVGIIFMVLSGDRMGLRSS